MMFFCRFLILCTAGALLSCGYRLGGLKAKALEDKHTYCVSMFANKTTQPLISQMVVSAIGDAMQRDGTYRLTSPNKADFTISGEVLSTASSSVSTSGYDTYVSSEIGMTVVFSYTIVDNQTGKLLTSGTVSEMATYYNNDEGNSVSARDSALSYAARLGAQTLVQRLTM